MFKILLLCSVLGSCTSNVNWNPPRLLADDMDALPPNEDLSEDSLTIVAFGNSITATRKTIKQVFAQRLPGLLAELNIHARVINAGVPGSHTGRINDHDLFKIEHGLDRLESAVLAHQPDITIIGFGTNDAHIDSDLANGPSRIPLKQYRRNLTFMIKQLNEIGSKIILIAPNPLGEKYPDFQNERLKKYVETVTKLSGKFKTGLVDNYQLFQNYELNTNKKIDNLMLDSVHPNDQGHRLIARELVREIHDIVINRK